MGRHAQRRVFGVVLVLTNLGIGTHASAQQRVTFSKCTNSEDSGHLFLVEKWASKEHYEKYHHWREERGDLQKIRDHLDGPVNRVFLDVVNG